MYIIIKLPISLLVWMLTGSLIAAAPQGADLGTEVSAAEVARWDMGVMPDGRGLPAGRGNARQGRQIYQQQCLACHGAHGRGGSAEALAGATMGLQSDYPEQTIGSYWPYATTLFDMIRRSKPMTAPGTLSDDEVYALTAYLLYLNDIVLETAYLDASTLPAIKMPNRDGFVGVDARADGSLLPSAENCVLENTPAEAE